MDREKENEIIRMFTDKANLDLLKHHSRYFKKSFKKLKSIFLSNDKTTESTFQYLRSRPCQETREPKEQLVCLYVTF